MGVKISFFEPEKPPAVATFLPNHIQGYNADPLLFHCLYKKLLYPQCLHLPGQFGYTQPFFRKQKASQSRILSVDTVYPCYASSAPVSGLHSFLHGGLVNMRVIFAQISMDRNKTIKSDKGTIHMWGIQGVRKQSRPSPPKP